MTGSLICLSSSLFMSAMHVCLLSVRDGLNIVREYHMVQRTVKPPAIPVFKCTMLGISSVLIKHQSCILLFWTLFDTCPYCYRHISLYVSSFISLIFWKNDIVFRPLFWKNNILFTYDFLGK